MELSWHQSCASSMFQRLAYMTSREEGAWCVGLSWEDSVQKKEGSITGRQPVRRQRVQERQLRQRAIPRDRRCAAHHARDRPQLWRPVRRSTPAPAV